MDTVSTGVYRLPGWFQEPCIFLRPQRAGTQLLGRARSSLIKLLYSPLALINCSRMPAAQLLPRQWLCLLVLLTFAAAKLQKQDIGKFAAFLLKTIFKPRGDYAVQLAPVRQVPISPLRGLKWHSNLSRRRL